MNKKRLIYIIMSAVMFISGGVLLFYFFWANGYINPPKEAPQQSYEEFTYPSLPSEIEPSQIITETIDPDKESKEGQIKNPVNFDELKKTNSDIIGWFYMTSPYISQPILMKKGNDAFYLSHDATGNYAKNGSLFVEYSYNKDPFNDPCTLIYGHRQSDGAMFGNLETTINDIDIIADPQYIVIYLPNSTKIYHIIATVCHDKTHILHYNNFGSKSEYDKFFNWVYKQSGKGVQLVANEKPQYGDKVLILSACLRTDRTKRYLVIAKELT